MNYEFNLLHHVGVVAKRVRAAAETTAAHKGDDNTPSGPTGRRLKMTERSIDTISAVISFPLLLYNF